MAYIRRAFTADRMIMHRPTLFVFLALLPLGGCARLHRGAPATPAAAAADAPPQAFVRSTAESRSTRTLPVKEGLTRAQLWRAALDVLDAKHLVEVRDQSAGFAMTAWEASAEREGVPDLRYRTRVVVDFLGDDWKQVTVRAEAQWRSSGDEWEVGYDAGLLEEVARELGARIGRPPVSAR